MNWEIQLRAVIVLQKEEEERERAIQRESWKW